MFEVIFQESPIILTMIVMSLILSILIDLISEFVVSFREPVVHTNVITIFTKISKLIIKYYFISDFLWN